MNGEKSSYNDIWRIILSKLSEKYSSSVMDLWFNDFELVYLNDSYAFLTTTRDGFISLLNSRYSVQIADYFKELLDLSVEVKIFSKKDFELGKALEGAVPEKPAETSLKNREDEGTGDYYQTPEAAQYTSSDTSYTFENFVVGSSNKMAYAASLSVSKHPAEEYNPLLIYGASGLGKTHLMKAIAHEVIKIHPEFKIVFVKGDDFTNELVEYIAKKNTAKFKEKYRKADMLLIDDVQFIAGRVSTQEEFFHTFNALYDDHKQIILTSDRPPREIQHLEERIRTRFEGGLMADIQPPDTELRIAILKNKAQRMGVNIPNDVLTFIGENVKSNIRQIEGIIKKLGAYSFVNNVPITLEAAKTQLAGIIEDSVSPAVTAQRIIEDIAKRSDLSPDDLKGKNRSKDIAMARHKAIYLIRKVTDLTYPNIGSLFNRDHTTIISSFEVIEKEMSENSVFEHEMNSLLKEYKQ